MKFFFWVCFAACYPSIGHSQKYSVRPAFDLMEQRAIVEGMTYDPVGKNFYFGESVKKRVIKYSLDGKSMGAIGSDADGITSILGMNVDTRNDRLWVCGAIRSNGKQVMCLFEYDLIEGALVRRYPDTSGIAQIFNDVVITRDGRIYATDTYGRALYTVDMSSGVSHLFIKSDSLRDANGITTDGEDLYVSTFPGITKVEVKTKKLSKLKPPDFHIAGNDGLYYYRNSLIGVQNVFFPVSITRYYLDEQHAKITKAELLSAADPSFVVPTTGAIVGDAFYLMSNNNVGKEQEQHLDKVRLSRIHLVL